VICDAGSKFSAGADIREMAELPAERMQKHAPALQRAVMTVAEIPKPVCAAIEKLALGGGLELALAADFRIFANDAFLGLPEIHLGVIPGAGGTQRLTRLVGPAMAKRLMMTGERLSAWDALELGIATQVAEPGTTVEEARTLLASLTEGPAAALRAIKRAVNGITPPGFRLETELFSDLFGTADQVEGMAAFLEKRKPEFLHPPISEGETNTV